MPKRTVTCSRCAQTLNHPLEICGHCGYAQLDRLSRRFWRSLGAGLLCFGAGLVLLVVGITGQVFWPFLGLFLAMAAFGGYWIFQALRGLNRRKTAARVNSSAAADARTITPVSREAVDMFDGTVGLGEAVQFLKDFFEQTGFIIEEEPVTNGMLFSGGKEFGEAGRPGLARYEIKVVVRSVRLQPVSVQAEIRETYVPIWDGYYARYRQYCNAWLGALRGLFNPPDLPPDLSDNRGLDPTGRKRLRDIARANNPHMEILAHAHTRELVRCRFCGGRFLAGTRNCCYCGQPISERVSRPFLFTGYLERFRRLKQP
jgi:hypothetical protein